MKILNPYLLFFFIILPGKMNNFSSSLYMICKSAKIANKKILVLGEKSPTQMNKSTFWHCEINHFIYCLRREHNTFLVITYIIKKHFVCGLFLNALTHIFLSKIRCRFFEDLTEVYSLNEVEANELVDCAELSRDNWVHEKCN